MTKTLLVPLIRPEEDPEGASAAALPMAQVLAERLGADVLLVSVLGLAAEATDDGGQRLLHAADAFPDDERLLAVKAQAEQLVLDLAAYLEQVAERFPASRVQTAVRFGEAGQELLNIAEELAEPIVVMSSHARRGFERVRAGSVAFKVVSQATYPVVIVPVTASEGPVALRRMLAPLDGSLLAEYALDAGLRLAGSGALEIHLVQVVETLTVRSGVVAGDYYAMAREEARTYLEGVAGRLRDLGHQAEWHIQLGLPAHEIAAVATEIDADMIVMATHGRSGLRRVVLGSVAERVLHSAQRPLLLFRPNEDDLKAKAALSSDA